MSCVVSAYWLLLWIRFKRLLRSSSADSSQFSLSDESQSAPEIVWRHFGAFTALVCVGELPNAVIAAASAVSIALIVTFEFYSQGACRASLLGHSTFSRKFRSGNFDSLAPSFFGISEFPIAVVNFKLGALQLSSLFYQRHHAKEWQSR